MKKYTVLVIMVLILGLTITSCQKTLPNSADSCSQNAVQSYYDDYSKILSSWEDADKVAGATGRISLGPIILTMQSVKRELDFSTPPTCLEAGVGKVVLGMESSIDGYIAFMKESDNGVIADYFSNGSKLMSTGNGDIEKTLKCAPNCD